jgi:hypothetical protein
MPDQRPSTPKFSIARARKILQHLRTFASHGGDPASAEAAAHVARYQHCSH